MLRPSTRAAPVRTGWACFTVVILWLGCTGCQFAPSSTRLSWPWGKKEPAKLPDRVMTVWSDSVLHQPGLPGVRGFGGRVYFYDTGGTDPIEVAGGLAVYVFDADELDPQEQTPLRKYVFTAEQFPEHMSKTTLGPSYSVWLPWDEVGGEARRLSLITRFQGSSGGTVISDPAIKLLPGIAKRSKNSESSSEESSISPVRTVGHQQHIREPLISGAALAGRGVQTIDLPPSLQRQMYQGDNWANSGQAGAGQPNPASSPESASPEWYPPLLPATPPSDASKVGRLSPIASNNVSASARPPSDVSADNPGQSATGKSKLRSNIRQGRSILPPR